MYHSKRLQYTRLPKSFKHIYPTIKFTHELEKDNQIPFLDILITTYPNKLEFDIYRKPTHTNNYIPADSFQPWNQKFAAFNSMIYRCINLLLNKDKQEKEIKKVMTIASNLGYTNSYKNTKPNNSLKTPLLYY